MEGALLTSADLRGILQISEPTLWRKIKKGDLPAPVTICGLRRWKRADIAALIDNAPGAQPKPTPRKRTRVA